MRLSSRQRSKVSSIDARLRLEDVDLEEQIDKLVTTGFLKNKEQTMKLAQLMVRIDDPSDRIKLLNVINNTQVQVFLRLFLDYHGLQLLWSWMVDAEDPLLKAAILQVLSILPIPNRTVLVDSKVLDMVQKWATEIHPINNNSSESQFDPVSQTINCQATRVSQDSCSNSQSSFIEALAADEMMPDDYPDKPLESNDKQEFKDESAATQETTDIKEENEEKVDKPGTVELTLQENRTTEDTSSQKNEVSSASVSQSPNEDKVLEEDILKDLPNISELAQRLLQQWKDLKEGFKIPRLVRQKRLDDEREAGETREQQQTVKPRDRNINSCPSDDPLSSLLIRRKKPQNQFMSLPQPQPPFNQFMDFVPSEGEFAHMALQPPQPIEPSASRVSKEQHRMQFEMDLMKRQYEEQLENFKNKMAMMQEEIERKRQMDFMANPDFITSIPSSDMPFEDVESFQPSLGPNYDPSLEYEYPPQNDYDNTPPQEDLLDYGYEYDVTMDIHSDWNVDAPILIECTSTENVLCMTDDVAGAQTDYGFELVPVKKPSQLFSPPDSLFDSTYPPPGVYYECTSDHIVFFVPQFQSNNQSDPGDFIGEVHDAKLPDTSWIGFNTPAPLPKHWSRKTDKLGRCYYLSKRSGKTQWALPDGSGVVVKTSVEDQEALKRKATLDSIVASADSTCTPPIPLAPSSSSPSNSQASPPGIFAIANGHDRKEEPDQSFKNKRKPKGLYDIRTKKGLEKFKEEVSEFVKKVLYPYKRPDCKLGRITSNDDFKFLARKVSHFIFVEEKYGINSFCLV